MKKKMKKPTEKISTPSMKLPKNHGEWLELCIKFTHRVMNDPPVNEMDKMMSAQSERLHNQLNEWRKNESKN